MAAPKHVIVIGAGISGLSSAYRLNQLGADVTLLEASNRAGGLIGTIQKDGFLFESGPQSFQTTDLLLTLIRELGIEADLQKANPRAPRYILLHGKLQKIPTSPQAMLTSSLLGVGSRWKILSEPFRKTRPPAAEESVAKFARRKFGDEILEYLVGPFVSGVYAKNSASKPHFRRSTNGSANMAASCAAQKNREKAQTRRRPHSVRFVKVWLAFRMPLQKN